MNCGRKIAIIGTGTIASSMAVLCTGHGNRTIVYSRSEKSSMCCMEYYQAAFEDMIQQGVITCGRAEICRTYLTITEDFHDLSDAELVFECIAENVDIKHEAYKRLGECCTKLRAICSVSSSIVPDVLIEGIDCYADRIIVTHPFHPVHMVPYFEVCGSHKTKKGVIEYAVLALLELDRKPVVLKNPTPGFIGNRLQFALLREAIRLVESQVADPEDIDTCLKYSFCPRYTSIGIFVHFDNGGLELCSTVCSHLFPVMSNETQVPKLIGELIEKGALGVKTGEGFYNWENVDMGIYQKRVNEPFWRFCNWNYPEIKAEEMST